MDLLGICRGKLEEVDGELQDRGERLPLTGVVGGSGGAVGAVQPDLEKKREMPAARRGEGAGDGWKSFQTL